MSAFSLWEKNKFKPVALRAGSPVHPNRCTRSSPVLVTDMKNARHSDENREHLKHVARSPILNAVQECFDVYADTCGSQSNTSTQGITFAPIQD